MLKVSKKCCIQEILVLRRSFGSWEAEEPHLARLAFTMNSSYFISFSSAPTYYSDLFLEN